MYLSSFSLATLLSTASSFTLHPSLNVGGQHGWSNYKSLVAFSGGGNALSKANAHSLGPFEDRDVFREHRLQSMSGFGGDDGTAALFGAQVPGMPDKVPKAPEHDEDNPMGGEFFRKMMEKAKKKQEGLAVEPRSILSSPTPAANYPESAVLQPVQLSQVDQMAVYQQQLQVWQQQMAAFAQLSAANPEAAAQMTMPPPPTPPTFTAPATIPPTTPQPDASASFSVPPQPPTENLANLDPKEFLPKGSGNKDAYDITNPADVYLAQLKRDSFVRTEARKRGDIDTANKPFEDVGIKAIGSILSKELIDTRRKQIAQNGGEFETSRDEMIIPYAEEEDTQNKDYTGISYRQKLMEMKKKRQGLSNNNEESAPPASQIAATFPQTAPAIVSPGSESHAPSVAVDEKPNFALPVTNEKDMAPVPAPSMQDSEEVRRSIRNLMGLILKQRGGPGFGAGRLKEAEAKRLETSAYDIIAMLKSEIGMEVSPKAPESVPTHVTQQKQVASTSASVPVPDRGGRKPSALTGAIACVDAAVSMYLNADPDSQKNLLVPVRDAIESALETMNEAIAKESSNTLGGASSQSQEPDYATTMAFPDTYAVTKPDPVEMELRPKPAYVGDSNTATLQGVYETLKSVAGDEKYGLRNVRSDEVPHIKDVLTDMRNVLMDELDNGIPSH